MKNISLHAPSLLTGLGVAALLGVAMSQMPVSGPVIDVRVVEPAVVYTPAHPRDFVRIVEGQPFVVPSGRFLVVTAIGSTQPNDVSPVNLFINGAQEVQRSMWPIGAPDVVSVTMTALPGLGLVAGSGDTVEVKFGDNDPDDARAWGYLADL